MSEPAALIRVAVRKDVSCFATVDLADFDRIMVHPWRLGTDGYARRYATKAERAAGAPRWIAMHREVMGLHLVKGRPGDPEVDHRNRTRLDNREENLRLVSRTRNNINRSANPGDRPVGVSWFKPAKLWRAYINRDRRRIELGYFKSKQGAIEARKAAEAIYHAEAAE